MQDPKVQLEGGGRGAMSGAGEGDAHARR